MTRLSSMSAMFTINLGLCLAIMALSSSSSSSFGPALVEASVAGGGGGGPVGFGMDMNQPWKCNDVIQNPEAVREELANRNIKGDQHKFRKFIENCIKWGDGWRFKKNGGGNKRSASASSSSTSSSSSSSSTLPASTDAAAAALVDSTITSSSSLSLPELEFSLLNLLQEDYATPSSWMETVPVTITQINNKNRDLILRYLLWKTLSNQLMADESDGSAGFKESRSSLPPASGSSASSTLPSSSSTNMDSSGNLETRML